MLRSHRGIDLGAAPLAHDLAREADAPLVLARASRLLVDANRSLHHRGLFSEWSRRLDDAERERIVRRYWRTHRDAVEARVAAALDRNRAVVHVSVHSFTSRWKGEPRRVDVAWLYDPARAFERAFSTRWLTCTRELRSDLQLRRNHPYRGVADGLTKHLRTRFAASRYAGVELEVSQRFPLGDPTAWRTLRRTLCAAFRSALGG